MASWRASGTNWPRRRIVPCGTGERRSKRRAARSACWVSRRSGTAWSRVRCCSSWSQSLKLVSSRVIRLPAGTEGSRGRGASPCGDRAGEDPCDRLGSEGLLRQREAPSALGEGGPQGPGPEGDAAAAHDPEGVGQARRSPGRSDLTASQQHLLERRGPDAGESERSHPGGLFHARGICPLRRRHGDPRGCPPTARPTVPTSQPAASGRTRPIAGRDQPGEEPCRGSSGGGELRLSRVRLARGAQPDLWPVDATGHPEGQEADGTAGQAEGGFPAEPLATYWPCDRRDQPDPARLGGVLLPRQRDRVLQLHPELGGEDDAAAPRAQLETSGLRLEQVEYAVAVLAARAL